MRPQKSRDWRQGTILYDFLTKFTVISPYNLRTLPHKFLKYLGINLKYQHSIEGYRWVTPGYATAPKTASKMTYSTQKRQIFIFLQISIRNRSNNRRMNETTFSRIYGSIR